MKRVLLSAAFTVSLIAEADTHMALSRDRELRYWSEPSKPEARRGAVLLAFKRAHPARPPG